MNFNISEIAEVSLCKFWHFCVGFCPKFAALLIAFISLYWNAIFQSNYKFQEQFIYKELTEKNKNYNNIVYYKHRIDEFVEKYEYLLYFCDFIIGGILGYLITYFIIIPLAL